MKHLKEMTITKTLIRANDLIKQHDRIRDLGYIELGRVRLASSPFAFGYSSTFCKEHMAKAYIYLNIAKWNLRVTKIYLNHIEDLRREKSPVKVEFT